MSLATFFKGVPIIGKIIEKGGNIIHRGAERRKGNQENREKRQHKEALAGLGYRKKFMTKALYTMAALPIIQIWFAVMSIPLINLWANLIDPDVGFGHAAIRLLAEDYMALWNTLGTHFIVGFIIQFTGVQGIKATNNIIDFKLKKAKTVENVEIKKVEAESLKWGKENKKPIYDIAFEDLMKHEGWYSYDKDDRGGETICGIARKFWPGWSGWKIVDNFDDKSELKNDASFSNKVKQFYYDNFWLPLNCDKLPDSIALELFDTGVNCGKKNATKFMQRALNNSNYNLFSNLSDDGSFGPVTLEATNALLPKYEKALLTSMNGEQYEHYQRIVERDPSQKKFFRGWMNRVNTNGIFIAQVD